MLANGRNGLCKEIAAAESPMGESHLTGGLTNGRSIASAGSAFRCKLLEERILVEKMKNERSELHAKMDGTGSK